MRDYIFKELQIKLPESEIFNPCN